MNEHLNESETTEQQENLSEIFQVRRDKLSELVKAGKNPYSIVKYDVDTYSSEITEGFEKMEGRDVSVAGRIVSKRGMGKASFIDILDAKGRIQSYVRSDCIGDESYADFKRYDIGDIIGVKGTVFRTQKGEISIHASEVTLLSKSLRPLPEKWHGLKDTDLRYRQRYVDLIVNPEVRRTFELRSKIVMEIRKYLDEHGFMEVETPILNTIPGGAAARPFITHHNTLDIDMYLRIATELHLKRLIVGGFDKVYEMGRIFRNEGMDIKHNPEFTTIELYQAYTDYNGMMDLCENLIVHLCEKILGTTELDYQGEIIHMKKPWKRLTMAEAVKEATGIDLNKENTDELARNAAKNAGFEISENATWGEVLSFLFEEKGEELITQPTFITEHPVEISPLAKRKADDPRLTERFELFITKREFANAFSELNDPIDQRERFLRQVELRNAGDEEANMMDEDFLNALEHGMPPTGGIGIGIDRLIMLLTNSYSIRDVLLFPTMKP